MLIWHIANNKYIVRTAHLWKQFINYEYSSTTIFWIQNSLLHFIYIDDNLNCFSDFFQYEFEKLLNAILALFGVLSVFFLLCFINKKGG